MSEITNRTWTVVQFDDSSVEAVPTNWIQGDVCHWPSMAHPKLIACIRKSEPLNICWPAHKIKVFRNATFDNYVKARSKARTAEETSDLASECEAETKKRRIQKIFSSSDESLDEISLLPSPPRRKIVETVSEDKSINEGKSFEMVQDELDSSVLPGTSFDSQEYIEIQNERKKYCCEGCQNNALKLKTVIQQNHLLRSLTTDILLNVQQLTELGDIKTKSQCDESLFIKYNLNFPLNSEEDIVEFDANLNNEKNFLEAVNELAKIGGANNYNMVKRILTSLISNDQAMRYSWLGRKGKKPFNILKVTQLMISSAEKAGLARSRKETEQSIQSWLKRAKERKDVNAKKF